MLFFGGGILKFIFGFLKLKIDMCRCSLFVRFLVFVCVCVTLSAQVGELFWSGSQTFQVLSSHHASSQSLFLLPPQKYPLSWHLTPQTSFIHTWTLYKQNRTGCTLSRWVLLLGILFLSTVSLHIIAFHYFSLLYGNPFNVYITIYRLCCSC